MMATSELDFCTLGMFITDEIEYTDGKSRADCIIGGAGTYATVGARLVAGAKNASRIGWIVDAGCDFPPEFGSIIDSWQTNCMYRHDGHRLTTRAWNGYGPNEHRAFRYLTPKLRLDEDSLSERQIMANAFHLVCSSARCISLVEGITRKRETLADRDGKEFVRPCFIWEPVPDLCTPKELISLKRALRYVDVISPNAEELAAFFASDNEPSSQEHSAAQLIDWGIGQHGNGILVVREGRKGCSAYSRSWECHLPAFYKEERPSAVVDPTGGGNTFLGAMAMGLGGRTEPSIAEVGSALTLSDVADAKSAFGAFRVVSTLLLATVAARFAIQQTGMPVLKCSEKGDQWNGDSFADRVSAYVDREKEYVRTNLKDKHI